jgi:hypothetical protein
VTGFEEDYEALEDDEPEIPPYSADYSYVPEADPLTAAYQTDPLAVIQAAVSNAADAVASQVSRQIELEAQQARIERMSTVAREASDAMREKYGPNWAQEVPSVLEVLKADAMRGVLPTDDALELARWQERAFLSERERTRPSRLEEDAARWQRVIETKHSEYGL